MDNKKLVLLVEDDLRQAQSLEMQLKQMLNYNCIVCLSYEDVIESLGQINDIDLVLMDVNLTNDAKLNLSKGYKGTGIELVERIRLLRKDLPIIYISAYAQNDGVMRSMKQNNNFFLSKPFYERQLKDTIEFALEPIINAKVEPIIEIVQDSILLKKNIVNVKVLIRDILFVESADGMLTAYTDKDVFTSSAIRTVDDFEALARGNGFQKIVRGIVINERKLQNYTHSYNLFTKKSTVVFYFKGSFNKKIRKKGNVKSMVKKLDSILVKSRH